MSAPGQSEMIGTDGYLDLRWFIRSSPILLGESIDGISGACGSKLYAIDFLSKCWKAQLKYDQQKVQSSGRHFFQTMKEN